MFSQNAHTNSKGFFLSKQLGLNAAYKTSDKQIKIRLIFYEAHLINTHLKLFTIQIIESKEGRDISRQNFH